MDRSDQKIKSVDFSNFIQQKHMALSMCFDLIHPLSILLFFW